MVVCVVNIHAYLSVTCALCVVVCYMCIVWGCVYMGISVCHCVSTFKMVDTSLQVYVHVYLITQVEKKTVMQFWKLFVIFPVTCYKVMSLYDNVLFL